MISKTVNMLALAVLIVSSLQVAVGFVVRDGNCTLATANLPFVKDFQLEQVSEFAKGQPEQRKALPGLDFSLSPTVRECE